MSQECDAGNLLLLDTDEPGISFRLLVDETLEPDLLGRAEQVDKDVFLKIPSGNLLLVPRSQVRSALKLGDQRASARVPAGNYLAEIYSIDAEPTSDYFKATLGPEDYSHMRAGCQAQSGGCLMGIAACVALAFALNTGMAGLQWLALALGIIGGLAFNWRLSRTQKRVRAAYANAKAAWERKYPAAAIVLRRQSDNADSSAWKGASVFLSH